MKFIYKNIKKFDIYGKGADLNINGNDTIKSFWGGFFSVLYFIFFLIILILNLYQLFHVRTPLITQSEIFRDQREYETITDKNFMLANFFAEVFPKIKPLEISPSNSTGIQENFEYINNIITRNKNSFGKFDDCDKSILYQNNSNFKPILDKSKKFSTKKYISCFDFIEKKNFTVGGNIILGSNKTKILLETKYDFCNLLRMPKGCNYTNNYMKNLSNVYLILIIKNNYIDKDHKDGYKELFQTIELPVDFSKNLKTTLTANRVNITTDNNLIYNLIPNVETNTIIYNIKTEEIKRDEYDKNFTIQFLVSLENYTIVIERTYLKFDGMLANVGSIVVMVEFLTSFLANFFTKSNMEHFIYREVFHIKKNTNTLNHKENIFTTIINKNENIKSIIRNNNEKNKNIDDRENSKNKIKDSTIFSKNDKIELSELQNPKYKNSKKIFLKYVFFEINSLLQNFIFFLHLLNLIPKIII